MLRDDLRRRPTVAPALPLKPVPTVAPAHSNGSTVATLYAKDMRKRNARERAHTRTAVSDTETPVRKRLPADWQPSPGDLDYAAAHGFQKARALHMAEGFKDYHRARGNSMASWPAAWRTWVRNETKFAGAVKGGGDADMWDRGI